jgi:hypothetical protein
MVDLANIVAGALVFGQLVSGQVIDTGIMVWGIMRASVFYVGAFSFSKERRLSIHMDSLDIFHIGLILMGVVLNIIGWRDYRHRRW